MMRSIDRFSTGDAAAERSTELRRFLDSAFDGDFSEEDWQHALGGWHLTVAEDGVVVAHAAVVPRVIEVGERRFRTGYVEAVATHPAKRRRGIASAVMVEVSELIRGAFEMGALSTGHPGFYRRLGWERWEGPTYVRDGPVRVRTEDEDGGIMVLRFGPSSAIELGAALSCERRRGDDW